MANSTPKNTEGQEKQLVNEANIEFKVQALRNKMLAEWAGGIMGYDAAHIKDYIKDVNAADLIAPGSDDVVEKVYNDIHKFNSKVGIKEIKDKVLEFSKVALKEITGR